MAKKEFRFDVGEKVRIIKAYPSSSFGVKEHQGEIVTIKARCTNRYSYEIEEYPEGTWADGCFEKIEKAENEPH